MDSAATLEVFVLCGSDFQIVSTTSGRGTRPTECVLERVRVFVSWSVDVLGPFRDGTHKQTSRLSASDHTTVQGEPIDTEIKNRVSSGRIRLASRTHLLNDDRHRARREIDLPSRASTD